MSFYDNKLQHESEAVGERTKTERIDCWNGSSPFMRRKLFKGVKQAINSRYRDVAQFGRARGLESWGRRFESQRDRQYEYVIEYR